MPDFSIRKVARTEQLIKAAATDVAQYLAQAATTMSSRAGGLATSAWSPAGGFAISSKRAAQSSNPRLLDGTEKFS